MQVDGRGVARNDHRIVVEVMQVARLVGGAADGLSERGSVSEVDSVGDRAPAMSARTLAARRILSS